MIAIFAAPVSLCIARDDDWLSNRDRFTERAPDPLQQQQPCHVVAAAQRPVDVVDLVADCFQLSLLSCSARAPHLKLEWRTMSSAVSTHTVLLSTTYIGDIAAKLHCSVWKSVRA